MLNQSNKTLRILRMPKVSEKTGLGRSAIYDRLDARSPRHDPTFPRPVTLGGGRAIGFVESEVDDWLAAQISKRNKAA